MESPFYTNVSNKTITFYLEPILDDYSQTYINVITLSDMPLGPLSQMVRMISLKKLSLFIDIPISNSKFGLGCTYILMKYPVYNRKLNNYMYADDIPALFTYLKNNGYIIEDQLSKMMNKSRIIMGGISDTRYSGDRKMICIVTCPI